MARSYMKNISYILTEKSKVQTKKINQTLVKKNFNSLNLSIFIQVKYANMYIFYNLYKNYIDQNYLSLQQLWIIFVIFVIFLKQLENRRIAIPILIA